LKIVVDGIIPDWYISGMTLSQYLRETGETGTQFAKRIGVAQATVHRYCSGVRIPRPEILQRIQAETGGQVTPNDFIGG